MNEHNRPDLILPNERLRAIARQAFEHDNSQEPEIDIIKHLVEGGEGWGILSSYFEAKMAQPLLIIGEQLPAGLRSVLNEAREAYLFGLSRATFALCRAALEELLEEVATAREIKLRVLDLGKERKLRRLIDAIPEAILDRARKDAAHEIAKLGKRSASRIRSIATCMGYAC